MRVEQMTTAPPTNVTAPRRARVSWALYDFANTIFSMNVATLYFSVWLVADLGASSTLYAMANGITSLLVVLSVPVLGAIADARGKRRRWVVGFTIASCIGCAAIGVFGQTTIPVVGEETLGGVPSSESWHPGYASLGWVLLAFVVANYAYQAAQPFYNAMMADLAPPEERGRLSGLGTAFGYVGTIVGLLLVFPFFGGAVPLFGALPEAVMTTLRRVLPFTAHAGRVSTFVPTALLFLLFSLPLFLFCHDRSGGSIARRVGWRSAFRDVGRTLRDARRRAGVMPLILASFLYQDAIGTIVVFMALYAVKAMGFARGSETTFFLVLTVPAIVGSAAAGYLVDRFGSLRVLSGTIVAWIVLLVAMICAPSQAAFWGVGLLIGLIFGGVPTAERTLLLSLVPEAEASRYFSLMLLSSRAAAIVGPLVWSVTVDVLEPIEGTAIAYRAAVGAVALMFGASLLLLRRVPRTTPAVPAPGMAPSEPVFVASL